MLAVMPFKPFPPVVKHHRELADFDWMAAIGMLATSLQRVSHCPVRVLTDEATDLRFPIQVCRYATTEQQLMLWNLEVCACFLESPSFSQDTVMLDADQLVYRDLSTWFAYGHDLGILVRQPPPSKRGFPIINGVQFWAHRAKVGLAAFYRRALAVARDLPEKVINWGADTEAIRMLLEPIKRAGVVNRCGLQVDLIESRRISLALSEAQIAAFQRGASPRIKAPVLDFRRFRKIYMQRAFELTVQK